MTADEAKAAFEAALAEKGLLDITVGLFSWAPQPESGWVAVIIGLSGKSYPRQATGREVDEMGVLMHVTLAAQFGLSFFAKGKEAVIRVKPKAEQSVDFEDDDWILFVSLVDRETDMSTSMVIESNHIWDIMSFIYDDIVNNISILVDSILHHHNYKVSSPQISLFNESKALIIAHASVIENKDVIFSIRDMLILPGVPFVVIVLVLRGLDLFVSRVGQGILSKYRRPVEVDRFMLLRGGEDSDDGLIVAL